MTQDRKKMQPSLFAWDMSLVGSCWLVDHKWPIVLTQGPKVPRLITALWSGSKLFPVRLSSCLTLSLRKPGQPTLWEWPEGLILIPSSVVISCKCPAYHNPATAQWPSFSSGHLCTLSPPSSSLESRLSVSMRPHGLCDVMKQMLSVSEDAFSKVPHWFIHHSEDRGSISSTRRYWGLVWWKYQLLLHTLPRKFQSLWSPQTALLVPT